MKSIFYLSLLLLILPMAQLEAAQKCRPESITPDGFWAQYILPAKAQANVKIRKKCIVNPDEYSDEYSDHDGYILDVEIGQVSYSEFLKLKTAFGNYSQVPYKLSKKYNLVDFLPPAMQVMVNKRFLALQYEDFNNAVMNISDPGSLSWIFSRSGLSSSSNCWNTVIENMTLMANKKKAGTGVYRLYWPGRWEVSDFLFDSKYSSVIPTHQAQFGDAVLIYLNTEWLKDDGKTVDYETKVLQHAGIAINGQLIYEKVDSGSLFPYRVALFNETFKKVKKFFGDDFLTNDEYKRESIRLEVRRFDFEKFAASPNADPTPYDILAGHWDFEDEDEKKAYAAELAQLPPKQVKDLEFTVGCETGLGGGCTQQITTVQRVLIGIDPNTGYGAMKPIVTGLKFTGGTQVLERFVDLTYLN